VRARARLLNHLSQREREGEGLPRPLRNPSPSHAHERARGPLPLPLGEVFRWLAFTFLLSLAACNRPPAVGAGDNWTSPGGDAGKTRYSRLTDINAGTVGRLGLAWSADFPTTRGLEATPVVIDGVMYVSGVAGRAYAFDAVSGKPIWTFAPPIDPGLLVAAAAAFFRSDRRM